MPPQTKGTALIDLVKLARQNVAAFEAVLPPATRAVVLQRILPTSWYPEEHLRDLLAAVDRLRGKGDLQSCVQLGRQSAQKDLSGVYRTGLVNGDPLATLASFPLLWQLYHDTGTAKFERLGPKVASLTLRDHGLPNRPLCLVTTGWIAEAVGLAGGQHARVFEDACRCLGGTICVYRAEWD